MQRLEHDRLVERTADGTLRVRDANLLLDAWGEAYNFEKHTIIRGHVTARDGEDLLTKAVDALEGKTHMRRRASPRRTCTLSSRRSGLPPSTWTAVRRKRS